MHLALLMRESKDDQLYRTSFAQRDIQSSPATVHYAAFELKASISQHSQLDPTTSKKTVRTFALLSILSLYIFAQNNLQS